MDIKKWNEIPGSRAVEGWPYTNLHDLNLDWIINTTKEFAAEISRFEDNVTEEVTGFEERVTVKIGEFEGTIQEYTDKIDVAIATVDEKIEYIDNFFSSLDVQQEINNKLDSMEGDGTLAALLKPFADAWLAQDAPGIISAWLAANITQPGTTVIDSSLTVSGAAADAKATGDLLFPAFHAAETTATEDALLLSASIPEGIINDLQNPLEGTVTTGFARRPTGTTVAGNNYQFVEYTFPVSYAYGWLVVSGHSWSNTFPLIAFYDENNILISYTGQANNLQYEKAVIPIPRQAVKAFVNGQVNANMEAYAFARTDIINYATNKVVPYSRTLGAEAIQGDPNLANVRTFPANNIFAVTPEGVALIANIPDGITSYATIAKLSPMRNRNSQGYSIYIISDEQRTYIGWDTGSSISWSLLYNQNENIASDLISTTFNSVTATNIVAGQAMHISGTTTSNTGYRYAEFPVEPGQLVYITGYHYSNSYPLFIIYNGNTRLEYSELGNVGAPYYQYKKIIPQNATRIIINGYAGTGPATVDVNYCVPNLQVIGENLLSEQWITGPKRKYLFIGDSYCEGYSHDGNNAGWAEYCAEYLGLSANDYIKAYVGGARFSANTNNRTYMSLLKQQIIPFDAITDIVVCGGYNDNSYTPAEIATGISRFCQQAKIQFPYAKIHIGFIAWNKQGNGAGAIANWESIKTSLISTVLPAYQNCIANGAIYLSNVEYWINDALLTNSDGYHPSEAGNRSLAKAIANGILSGCAPLPYNAMLRTV